MASGATASQWEIRWSNSRSRVRQMVPRSRLAHLHRSCRAVGRLPFEVPLTRRLVLQIYFFNAERSESRWEVPEGLTPEDVRSLPGHELLTKSAPSGGGGGTAAPSSGGGEPKRVQASHLLIKHAESRRPSSWKEVRASAGLTSSFARVGSGPPSAAISAVRLELSWPCLGSVCQSTPFAPLRHRTLVR